MEKNNIEEYIKIDTNNIYIDKKTISSFISKANNFFDSFENFAQKVNQNFNVINQNFNVVNQKLDYFFIHFKSK